MLTEDQRMQMMYTGIANCFCTERTLTWSRNQLFTVINFGGLSIAVAPPTPAALVATIAVVGVILCALWFLVNHRMRKRIRYWQDCLARMEPSEASLLVFRVFTGSGANAIGRSRWFYMVIFLPTVFVAMWTVVFLSFLF